MNILWLVVGAAVNVASACDVLVEQILGEYGIVKGETIYEDFSLEHDGTFKSWIHQRPGLWGKWQYNACKIDIYDESGFVETITVISVSEKSITLKFDDVALPTVFGRYK